MKILSIVALLLLLAMVGLQASCCKHAVKIEKVIDEKRVVFVTTAQLIH